MADAKKKPSPKSKGKSKGASRSNRSAAFVAFLKSERFAHIRGAAYVLFSIFLVISLAGYCTASNGHRLCFAMINQGALSGKAARNYQDKICDILCE